MSQDYQDKKKTDLIKRCQTEFDLSLSTLRSGNPKLSNPI